MQGIIYGVHTSETALDPRLRTRLDVDEMFGTVINRLVAEACIHKPLTVYGKGSMMQGTIALEDAMECMNRLINAPPVSGQYSVVNQFTRAPSVNEVAEIVKEIGRDFVGRVDIKNVPNPRIELEDHPFEPIADRLSNEFNFHPKINLRDEIRRMFEVLTQENCRKKLLSMADHMEPKTTWIPPPSKDHKRMRRQKAERFLANYQIIQPD
jgi:UDP-sulfoquinovose synthase